MDSLEGIDLGAQYFFERHHQQWLTQVMMGLTRIADAATVIFVVALAVAGFLATGRKWTAAILLASLVVAVGIAYSVKDIVRRPRPDVPWNFMQESITYSFPSGHSCNSMAGYFAASLLIARRLTSRWGKVFLPLGVFAFCLLVGVSRIYLGKHFLTDVVAGWSLGLGCALTALAADLRWAPTTPPHDSAEKPSLV